MLPSASPRPPLREALLARRERHPLTAGDRRLLRGQRMLVTGAAGYLGAELVRRLALYRPAQLTLFDQSGSGLARLELELLESRSTLPLAAVLGDVSRGADIRSAIRGARPDVVFHLASASEVSTAERAVCTTVRTNVFGTLHVAREAALAGARLVVVSSHDAERAATVAGATRRLAELVSLCPAQEGFRPVIVRLDELVERPGGPVESMVDRLRGGRPIVVPNPQAAHLLLTAAEAVSLILKADLVGGGGEIYRLDTGPAQRVVDVAHRLIEWAVRAGFSPVPIRVLSAGDLEVDDRALCTATPDGFEPSTYPALRVQQARMPDTAAMTRILRALREDLRRRDALAALADLRAAVPGFEPSRTARELAAAATLRGIWPSARLTLPLSA